MWAGRHGLCVWPQPHRFFWATSLTGVRSDGLRRPRKPPIEASVVRVLRWTPPDVAVGDHGLVGAPSCTGGHPPTRKDSSVEAPHVMRVSSPPFATASRSLRDSPVMAAASSRSWRGRGYRRTQRRCPWWSTVLTRPEGRLSARWCSTSLATQRVCSAIPCRRAASRPSTRQGGRPTTGAIHAAARITTGSRCRRAMPTGRRHGVGFEEALPAGGTAATAQAQLVGTYTRAS